MRKREHRVYMHLSENELVHLEKLVAESKLKREVYIRRACLEDGAIIIVDRELLKKIYAEVNRLGNNINQITHLANSSKSISDHEIKLVLEWQRQLQITISRELKGIRR